jgi:hypothetical protein
VKRILQFVRLEGMSWSAKVGIVTVLGAGLGFRSRDFSVTKHLDWHWGPPCLLCSGFFLRGKSGQGMKLSTQTELVKGLYNGNMFQPN